jgi:LPPG:FO 2-phospho-L-lactate transferase
LKGPTVKMLQETGSEADAAGVARRYRDVLDGYVVDAVDAAGALDIPVATARTVMVTLADREILARAVLGFADRIAATGIARAAARTPR